MATIMEIRKFSSIKLDDVFFDSKSPLARMAVSI